MAELDEVFRAESNAHLEVFVPGNACPDQYVADLDQNPLLFSRRLADQVPRLLAPVVLILESPHSEEYIDRDNPVPANGTTGERIKAHLWRALEHLPDANFVGRPLILANAIQYQCSLGGCRKRGIPTRFHRDRVFERMWNLETKAARTDFSGRLLRYVGTHRPFSQNHLEGYVVVNACTKGISKRKRKRELRVMVEDVILDTLKHESHIKVVHPSAWMPHGSIPTWT